MWNPFKKVILEPINNLETINNNPDIQLSVDTEIAQLRSLKARIEIKMLYERLAEDVLMDMKGRINASSA